MEAGLPVLGDFQVLRWGQDRLWGPAPPEVTPGPGSRGCRLRCSSAEVHREQECEHSLVSASAGGWEETRNVPINVSEMLVNISPRLLLKDRTVAVLRGGGRRERTCQSCHVCARQSWRGAPHSCSSVPVSSCAFLHCYEVAAWWQWRTGIFSPHPQNGL